MIHLRYFLLCLLFSTQLLAQSTPTSSTNTPFVLRIGTMLLPPYGWVDENNLPQGLIFEMNDEIGKRSHLPYTNTVLPFNRMLKMLKDGQLDLVSSQPHEKALDAGDKLAVQHLVNVIIGTKKNSNIHTLEDIKDKHLVYHYSASYPKLTTIRHSIQRVRSYKQSMELLYERSWIDGAIFSEPAYYYWMKFFHYDVEDFGTVIFVEKDIKQWIFVRKDLPDALRTKLAKIVDDIFQEKMYEKLLIKYGKPQ